MLTRNDQLLLNANSKAARKQKIEKNKKKRKGKKARKGNKKKKTRSLSNSPSKRRAILARASSSRSLDATSAEPTTKKAKGHASDVVEPEPSKPPKRKQHTKAAAKAAAKAKAKAKAKACKEKKPARQAANKGTQPKAKAKGQAKAKANKRNKGTLGVDDESHPLFSKSMVDTFIAFAKEVGGEGVDHKGSKFKNLVRSKLEEFQSVGYNVYWSRCSCGLTCWEAKCDLFNFSFSLSGAHESFRTACSVKCAEMAVACFKKHVFFFLVWGIFCTENDQISTPNILKNAYIYIYIFIYPKDRLPCSLFPLLYTTSEARGYENEEPGFEKNGDKIEQLKHNARVALFRLENENTETD